MMLIMNYFKGKEEEEQSDKIQSLDTQHAFSGYGATSTQISAVLTDTDLSQKIRSLNLKQGQMFCVQLSKVIYHSNLQMESRCHCHFIYLFQVMEAPENHI